MSLGCVCAVTRHPSRGCPQQRVPARCGRTWRDLIASPGRTWPIRTSVTPPDAPLGVTTPMCSANHSIGEPFARGAAHETSMTCAPISATSGAAGLAGTSAGVVCVASLYLKARPAYESLKARNACTFGGRACAHRWRHGWNTCCARGTHATPWQRQLARTLHGSAASVRRRPVGVCGSAQCTAPYGYLP
jgi:hypothetical protein